jgi:hypothetical protein
MVNCSIPGCGGAATAHGLCPKHYMRVRRRGDAASVGKPGRPRRQRAANVSEAEWQARQAEVERLRAENAGLHAEVTRLNARAQPRRQRPDDSPSQAEQRALHEAEARRLRAENVTLQAEVQALKAQPPGATQKDTVKQLIAAKLEGEAIGKQIGYQRAQKDIEKLKKQVERLTQVTPNGDGKALAGGAKQRAPKVMPAFNEREYSLLQKITHPDGKPKEWQADCTRASALLNARKEYAVIPPGYGVRLIRVRKG